MSDTTGVNVRGAGFVPYCLPCGYIGKPQSREAKADAQVRQHECLAKHRMNLLRASGRARVAA